MKLDNLEVSFALYKRVSVLRDLGRRLTIQPGHDGDCPNCQDVSGFMYMFLLETESEHYEAGMLPMSSGGYGRFKITGWPCPLCNTEKIDQTQEKLAAASGLIGSEFDWSMDFYKGMKGKQDMIQLGKSLCQAVPLPTGFHTLYGDYGRGKSGMAKVVTAAMVNAGGNGMYRRAVDILEEIKNTFNLGGNEISPDFDYAKTEAGAIQKYKSAQLLVVDEVDRTSQKEWSTSTIFTILDHRYNLREKICTLVITNQHPDKLGEVFGYLASRMKDGYRIPAGGRELRGGVSVDEIPV